MIVLKDASSESIIDDIFEAWTEFKEEQKIKTKIIRDPITQATSRTYGPLFASASSQPIKVGNKEIDVNKDLHQEMTDVIEEDVGLIMDYLGKP